jgi:hypothetical protein
MADHALANVDTVIDLYSEEEETEFRALLTRLDKEFPPVSGKGFDFSRIRGNFAGRTAKAIVLHLSYTGWSLAEIADAIGVPVRIVSRYLIEAIREASPIEDVEVLRQFEERKLDEQAKVCWEQFQRSCEDAKETHEVLDKDGNVQTLTNVKPQSGNPAYHRVLLDISRQRAKLNGLEKPVRVEVDKTERKLVVNVVEVKSREEVEEARAAGLLE